MTIRLLLPFLCLECKGFHPETSFPQHGDSEGAETGNCPPFCLIIRYFIGDLNKSAKDCPCSTYLHFVWIYVNLMNIWCILVFPSLFLPNLSNKHLNKSFSSHENASCFILLSFHFVNYFPCSITRYLLFLTSNLNIFT